MEIKQKYHVINLEEQDINLKKVEEFLNLLKNDYKNFKSELTKADKEWKEILSKNNNKNILFQPEKTLIRSPITIIDAPWGMGKTRFIEEIGKCFIRGELEDYDYFDNVIIIDTWKFCNYDDITNTVINELAKLFLFNNNLLKSYNEEFKKQSFLNKIKSKLKACVFSTELNYIHDNSGNLKYSVSLNEVKWDRFHNNKKEKEEEKEDEINILIENWIKNPPKTLLFFDNIERLGSFSWDIIKLIQRLSSIENFIIIFPMDKNKLKVIDFDPIIQNSFNSELYIEKYIQLKYYKLIQNYKGILTSIGFEQDYIEMINSILISEEHERFFSIREIEKIFLSNKMKVFFYEGKYHGLKHLQDFLNDSNHDIRINSIVENEIKTDIQSTLKFKEIFWDWHLKLIAYLKDEKNQNTWKILIVYFYYRQLKKSEMTNTTFEFLLLSNSLDNLVLKWDDILKDIFEKINNYFDNDKEELKEMIIYFESVVQKDRQNFSGNNDLIVIGEELKQEIWRYFSGPHLNRTNESCNNEIISFLKNLKENPLKENYRNKILLKCEEFKELEKNHITDNDNKQEIWRCIVPFIICEWRTYDVEWPKYNREKKLEVLETYVIKKLLD